MTPADVAADCLYLYPTVDPGLLQSAAQPGLQPDRQTAISDIFFAQAVPFRGTARSMRRLRQHHSTVRARGDAETGANLPTATWRPPSTTTCGTPPRAPDRAGRAFPGLDCDVAPPATSLRRPIRSCARVWWWRCWRGPRRLHGAIKTGLVGGTFKQIPLCTSVEQTGCVLTYNSFAASPPPSDGYTRVTGRLKAGSDTGCTAPPAAAQAPRPAQGRAFPIQISGGLLPGLSRPRSISAPSACACATRAYADFYTGRCVDSDKGSSSSRITPEPRAGDRPRGPFRTITCLSPTPRWACTRSTTPSSPRLGRRRSKPDRRPPEIAPSTMERAQSPMQEASLDAIDALCVSRPLPGHERRRDPEPSWTLRVLSRVAASRPRFPRVARALRVVRCVGRGGMGKVFEARDRKDRREGRVEAAA